MTSTQAPARHADRGGRRARRPPPAHRQLPARPEGARRASRAARPAGARRAGRVALPAAGGRRGDIEGLRAVAVAGVLLYHAGVPTFSGGFVGVDVFFVISGFLITGLVANELVSTGTVRLGRFFARRVKRLLPLSLVVLAAVAVLSAWLSDPVARPSVARDLMASALYSMNWRLAAESVAYGGVDSDVSPLQHYWTLGVEEQFYLVWPALLLVAAFWWRRRGGPLRLTLGVVVTAVGTASFVYAERLLAQSANLAYYSTFARGWELALGALLALLFIRPPRIPGPVRLLLGAGGLAAVVASMVLYDAGTPFPGTSALLPTLGVAGIIAAGTGDPSTPVARLLSLRPVRHVGRISYSWYLWHWPLLVFAGLAWGELSTTQGLLVTAASYVPTLLTHRWVEQPLHHSRGRWTRPVVALPLGAVASLTAVAMGTALTATTPEVRIASDRQVRGAQTMPQQRLQVSARALRPDPLHALTDRAEIDRKCLAWQTDTRIPPGCVRGVRSSSTTVALLGDSHALQYAEPLARIARKEGWRLLLLAKAGCPPVDALVFNDALGREYDECQTWLHNVTRRIRVEQPSLLVTSANPNYNVVRNGHRLGRDASHDLLAQGYRDMLARFTHVPRIAVIAEHPHLGDVPGCVAEFQHSLNKCARPRREAMDFARIDLQAASQVDKARLVDPIRKLCLEDTCPAVIGNVVVYRGDNHLTATYANTMTPWLHSQLAPLA
jgi:peptidoglycan/LPS O-acetylase OafA/YrhL